MNDAPAPTPGSRSSRLPRRGGRRPYVIAALLLALALAAGGVIGFGAAVMHFGRRRQRPPRPEEIGDKLVAHMADFLKLGDSETMALRTAVDNRMARVKAIRDESWNAIRDEFDGLSVEARGIVGDERYQKWELERDRRMGERKNLKRGRGPGGQRGAGAP